MTKSSTLGLALFLVASPLTTGCGDDADEAAGSGDVIADAADTSDSVGDAEVAEIPDFVDPPAKLGGAERPAVYFVPSNYDPAQRWPVIVLLHGFGVTGAIQDLYWGLSKRVDEDGFFLITPDGMRNSSGEQFWNATSACCDMENMQPDDFGYLLGLVDELALSYHVDPDRIYFTGHSNGGFMSHYLACDGSERVAAIASLAGSSFEDGERCQPDGTPSILQVHGTLDDTIPYDGSTEPGFAFPGAVELVEQWAQKNGCTGALETVDTIDLMTTVPGAESMRQTFAGCPDGVDVALWTLPETGHIPGFTPIWAEELTMWLLSHRRAMQPADGN